MLCFPLLHAVARHVLRGLTAQPCCRPRASLAPSYSRVRLASDRLLPEPAAGSVRSDDDEQEGRALACAPVRPEGWSRGRSRARPGEAGGEALACSGHSRTHGGARGAGSALGCI